MECPMCGKKMKKIKDVMPVEKICFEAFECSSCGEELMNMDQLKALANKYRKLRKAKDISFAKWGNSIAVRIPKNLVEELGIQEGGHGLITKEKSGILIIPIDS